MLNAVIVVVTCLVNLLLGLFVLLRNPKQRTGLAFFSVSLFISLWAVSNYITSDSSIGLTYNNIFNTFAFVAAFLAVSASLWFTSVFPVLLKLSVRTQSILLTMFAVTMVISDTTLVGGHVTKAHGNLHFSTGPLLPLYILVILIFLTLIVVNLRRVVVNARGREREQAVYLLIGFSVPIFLGLLTNTIVPLFTASWNTATFGPIFTVFLVGTTSYAIIRHRLFDVRLAVARSVAYIASILAVVAAYTVLAFGLLNIGFGLRIGAAEGVTLAFFTAVTALIFQPIKRAFDRLTNRIFYQDAYDSQQFFNEFNQALVSTISLDEMLLSTTQTIATYLKAQYCLVGIENVHGEQRIIGTKQTELLKTEIAQVRQITPRIHQTVIVADDISPEHNHLRELLSKNDISVLARITDDVNKTHEGLGYIVLGAKKSGNPYTDQDIRVLEAAANELVIAIQNALRFEEIQNFNLTLQGKVDDATRKLRHANEKLKALDETKDDFISMASHQLRTPLTSVKGYISMVLEGDAGELTKQEREMLGQAFFSSQRMVYLIADLLNVSRLKTGKFIIDRVQVNLATLVQQELEQLKETAASRQLTLNYEQPKDFPDVMLDETKTRQVIMNFVDNAIYYTPAGGHIDVVLIDNPTTIELRVVDDGIGVPKQEQPHLFTKFYRAPNARKARPDGTGLGLFMAKKVIIAEEGSIIFESQLGKGSTFGFMFSKAKVMQGLPEPVPAKSKHVTQAKPLQATLKSAAPNTPMK